MNPIKDFAQMTAYLQSYSERKRVVVVCPNDPHTEYAVLRALKERLTEFVLIQIVIMRPELKIYETSIRKMWRCLSYPHRMMRQRWLCRWFVKARLTL